MADQVPPRVVQERYERLVAVAGGDRLVGGEELVGRTVEVLVAEGEGRKDAATSRVSGRARDNRLVHVGGCDARPGDVVEAIVGHAAPHHLTADVVMGVRRTAGGDAWQAHHGSPRSTSAPSPVLLGLPGRPR